MEVGPSKVKVRFQPLGLVPLVNPRVINVSSALQVSGLLKYLNGKLNNPGNLHLYVQSSFEPALQESVGDLYANYRIGDELIVGYCLTVAFG